MTTLTESLGGLVKSAAIIFVATILGRALGLLGEMLIVRSLAPGAFGHLALAYTIVLTSSRLALVGIPDGVTRLLSADIDSSEYRELVQSGFVVVAGFSVAVATVIYLARPLIARLMDDPELATLLEVFVVFVLVMPVARVAMGVLRAQHQSGAAALANDVGPRTVGLGVFLLLASLGMPYLGAISYWLVLPMTVLVVALGFIHHEYDLRTLMDVPTFGSQLQKLLSFSWPLAVASSFIMLLANLDVLMVGYFLKSSAVGYYRAVQPLRQATWFVLSAFVFLYLPIATEYYGEDRLKELRRFYVTASKWIAILTFPVVLVFTLFASDVVRVLFGPEYLPAAPVLTVLSAGLYFNALVGPNGATIQAIDQPRVEMVAAGVGVVVNVVLNVLLIPSVGIVGAALATVASYICYNVVEVLFIYRQIDATPFTMNAIKPLITTLAVGLVLLAVIDGATLTFGQLVIMGFVISAVQLGAVILTRSLDETDLLILSQFEDRFGIEFDRTRRYLERRT